MDYWSVIQSHPACETRALWHMTYQGFKTYAPRERVTYVVRGKKVQGARWLFPRYIFVWITDTWHALFSTIAVSRVLMNGEQPAHVPDGFVESMRAREHKGLIIVPKHRFAVGQHVQVTGGLFAGERAIYQGMNAQQREFILLEAIGVRVEMASGLLR